MTTLNKQDIPELKERILRVKTAPELSHIYLNEELGGLLTALTDLSIENEADHDFLADLLEISFKIMFLCQVEDLRLQAMDITSVILDTEAFNMHEALRLKVWRVLILASQFREDKRPHVVKRAYDLLRKCCDSEHISIRMKATRFYCDKKSNPNYHLLTLDESDNNTEFIVLLEKNMQRLIKAGYKEYQCAVSEHGTISTKELLSYYFDLFINGKFALGDSQCDRERRNYFYDVLTEFAKPRQIDQPIDDDTKHLQDYFDQLASLSGKALLKHATQFESHIRSDIQNPGNSYVKEDYVNCICDAEDYITRLAVLSEKTFGKTLVKAKTKLNDLKKACESKI